MKFNTMSGSTYEVDVINKQIRRLSGQRQASIRQGKDGEWKSYSKTLITPQNTMLIFWDKDVKPIIEGAMPATETTEIVSVEISDDEKNTKEYKEMSEKDQNLFLFLKKHVV